MRGKRGQKLLRDLLAALDAMPEKRLVANEIEVSHELDMKRAERWSNATPYGDDVAYYFENILRRQDGVRNGDVCALGAVGRLRGIDMSELDPDDSESVAAAFDIADPLAREIVFWNDEGGSYKETPEQRWQRMRAWVANQIVGQ